MRAEFFAAADGRFSCIAELQQALDGWVVQYDTERPHQSLGMCPPVEPFRLAAGHQPSADIDRPVGQGSVA